MAQGTLGGGICSFGNAILTNCTLSGNFAHTNGGAAYFSNQGSLTHCTITLNTCDDLDSTDGGGGIYTTSNLVTVKNSIIADNFREGAGRAFDPSDVNGMIISQGNNLIGDGADSIGFAMPTDQVGTTANPIDPMLAPLANNGGATMTHALLPGSRAIDRGNNTGAPTTDQRGLPRIKDGDNNGVRIVDIGAFEL